nr:diaminohydroxyphosphoribosylaminopyrimidine deaminase [Candidatus Cloacimonadota bacterium]
MDRYYLKLALRIAERSRGICSPNPFVGALIVKDGKIISEGSTQPYGYDHAEIVALKAAGEHAYGASLYVTLEPCCHFGMTPPCTEAIIKAGIKRVVIGIEDPNPKVAGKGIQTLRNAGIEVSVGFFEEEIKEQLEYYLCFILKKRPFIIWKSALSLDGKYAASDGSSRWISNLASRQYVHKIRSQVDVVLAGVKSVNDDDALLNARLAGNLKQPLRLVLDPHLDIKLNSRLVTSAHSYPTMIMYHEDNHTKLKQLESAGVRLHKIYGQKDELALTAVIDEIYKMNFYSVLLEAGNRLSESFWELGLVDKCFIFYGNKILGGDKGVLSNFDRQNIDRAIILKKIRVERLHDNVLISGYPSISQS